MSIRHQQREGGEAKEFENVGNLERNQEEKKTVDETIAVTTKEKASKDEEFELEPELKNGKNYDLDRLDHTAKADFDQKSELEESANKEKAGEAKNFEKAGKLKGNI